MSTLVHIFSKKIEPLTLKKRFAYPGDFSMGKITMECSLLTQNASSDLCCDNDPHTFKSSCFLKTRKRSRYAFLVCTHVSHVSLKSKLHLLYHFLPQGKGLGEQLNVDSKS